MIPTEKNAMFDKDTMDVTVSSLIAIVAGWLVKSVFSASKKDVDIIRDERRHFIDSKVFDREIELISTRLDRIEEKIDKVLTR